ncbi:MAG: vWA domain-containing protein [Pseudomonadota bacterium]
MMFALFLIPLVAAVGIGVDFVQSSSGRTRVAEATDAAVLAAARAKMRDQSLTQAQLNDIANGVFKANIEGVWGFDIDGITLKSSDSGFSANTVGRYKTAFMRIIGNKTIDFAINSRAEVAPPRLLEAVLVLDNTGSMKGSRLTALKNASNAFVDSVMTEGANSKVGVVPFSTYVNVGRANMNAPWLQVAPDETRINCRNTYPDRVVSNCRDVPKTCYRSREAGGGSFPCTERKCDEVRGDPVEVCSPYDVKFRGCVGSRSPIGSLNLDATDDQFTANPVPGLRNIYCSRTLLPLTSNKSDIKAKIRDMNADRETYIPAGLTWGLRVISATAPYTEGTPIADVLAQDGKKAIVMMTDGANTKSASYPRHDQNSTPTANTKTLEICDVIKARKIELYTIALEVTDTATKEMLEQCATSQSYYFDVTDASQLIAEFENIAAELKELALVE